MLYGHRSDNVPGSDNPAASPGFTWGKSGKVSAGAYLLNDTVPSNKSGRSVPVIDGLIVTIFLTVENNTTCTIAIERRVGAVFTEIATISLVAARTNTQAYSVAIDYNDEIAVRVKTGSCKNPVVGVVMKGDSV